MTVETSNKPNWKMAIGIPFCIFISCFLITFSLKFKLHPDIVSNAILMDLLITAPFIYFLAIRKSSVSVFTVSRVFIAGLLMAGFILPAHSSTLLHNLKTWVSPVIEGMVIFFIARKFYVANKKAKETNTGKVDFLIHCRSILHQVTGNEKVGNIFSSEIAVMYYAFFSGKDKFTDNKTRFSSYKENGVQIVLGAILSIFLIETIGVHFLLSLWSKTIAWVFTSLSFYTCIQLFAHIRAIRARPIIINTNSFEVHNGLAGDAYIQFDNLEKIELSNKSPLHRQSVKMALLRGLESHNMVVYLKQPIVVTKMFGIKKRADTILFFVDRPNDFLNSLNEEWETIQRDKKIQLRNETHKE